MKPLVVGWIFTVINYALFYTIGIIVARWFGAGDFGDYSVAVAVLSLLGTAATLGLGKSSLNMLTVYRQRAEWSLYHGYVRRSVSLILFVSIVLGLAFWGGFSLYEKFIDTARSHPARILVVYFIPAAAIVFFLSQVLIANNRFIYSVVLQRFQLPLQVLVILLLFHHFITGITIEYAIFAYGISWLLCSISNLLVAFLTHERDILMSKPVYKTKLWLSNAYPYLANTLVLNTLGAGTLILLEFLHVSESDIGIYAAASRTAVLLIVLMKQGDRFFLPKISGAIETGDTDQVNRILRTRFRALGSLSIFFLILMIFFGRDILGLFGEEFRQGYHILLIFLTGIIIDILAGISASILQIVGKNSLSLKVSLTILLINIVLNIVFIPIWGLEAAVTAVNASIAAVNIFSVVYLYRNYRIRVISHY